MIIIDENAEQQLIKTLEQLRNTPGDTAILHFAYSCFPDDTHPTLHAVLTDAIRNHLTAHNPQIFFCNNGDAWVLAPGITESDARDVMVDTARHSNVNRIEDVVIVYQAEPHATRLLQQLKREREAKKASLHAAVEAQEEARAEAQQQRKRAAILEENHETAEIKFLDAALNRSRREHPEVMVIEDDAFSRRLLENVLGREFRLTLLADAETALATYRRLAPDILFLDINLPDVTGHELLERITAMDPQAYVIMLSGNSDRDNIMQAMNKGAKGFIAKPFTREKLYQYIDRCPTIKKTDA